VVVVDGGTFLTGSLSIPSNITLTINTGAVILGSLDLNDYPIPQGAYNSGASSDHSLIHAYNAKNIVINGGGVIDGNGVANPLWNGVAQTPVDPSDRPITVLIGKSTDITLDNVTVRNSANWTVVLAQDDRVEVNNVKVDSAYNAKGLNLDGIDVIDSSDAVIENSVINSQDDSIVLKSSFANIGLNNIKVSNVTVSSLGANGLKLGTATVGRFSNIVFDRVTVDNVHYCAMEVESVDGGAVSNVTFSNITVNQTGSLLYVMLASRVSGLPGSIDGVTFDGIQASNMTNGWGNSISGVVVNGVTYAPSNITVRNLNFSARGGATAIPSAPDEYPYAATGSNYYPDVFEWKALPAYAFYIRHAKNVNFGPNISINVSPADVRPAFSVASDVTGTGF